MSERVKRIEQLTIWANGKLEAWAKELVDYNVSFYESHFEECSKLKQGRAFEEPYVYFMKNEISREAMKRWALSKTTSRLYADFAMNTIYDPLIKRAIELMKTAGYEMDHKYFRKNTRESLICKSLKKSSGADGEQSRRFSGAGRDALG